MLRTTGKLLAAHWPALLTWFLAGELGRYLSISTAAYVAQVSAFAGSLLVGLGVLAKLLGLVAMLLVMRDGLRTLRGLAPTPEDPAERRRFFVDAVMTAIVPFFLFYEVWGYLRDDWVDFARRATDIWVRRGGPGDIPQVASLGVSIATVSTAVAAFALVWAWRRFRDRLPKWTAVPSLLCEMLWTYLFVLMLGDAIGASLAWLQSRRVLEWFVDLRGWLSEVAAPIAWLWDGAAATIVGAVDLLALPFAWVTIAGVIYGVALEPKRRSLIRSRRLQQVQEGWKSTPTAVRVVCSEIAHTVIDRVEPIWKAFSLLFHAGPIMVFGYVLAYTVTLLAEQLLRGGIILLLGPHDLRTFWQVADTALFLAIPLIVMPIRMALVASSYDEMLERSTEDPSEPAGPRPSEQPYAPQLSETHPESEELRQLIGDDHVDEEGTLGVGREQEGHDQLEPGR